MSYQPRNHPDKHINLFVGIDPDLTKSGFAVWDRPQNKLTDYRTLAFYDIMLAIRKLPRESTLVIVEAGWLNKVANFHTVKVPDRLKGHDAAIETYTRGVRERTAKDVGQNHAAGKLLVECIERMGYTVRFSKPTKKKWEPHDFKRATGITVKNQEIIDAGRLVIGR